MSLEDASKEDTIKLTYEVLLRLQDEPQCQSLGSVFKTMIGSEEHLSLKNLIERLDTSSHFRRLKVEIEKDPFFSDDEFQSTKKDLINVLLTASDILVTKS